MGTSCLSQLLERAFPAMNLAIKALIASGWVRSFHGTGVGTSTNNGFWIPGPPPEKEPSPEPLPPPPPKEKKVGRKVGHKPRPPPTAAASGSKVTRHGSSRLSTAVEDQKEAEQPKPAIARRPKRDIVKKEDTEDDPVPKFERLLELREGIPEDVRITCNGHAGLMNVRTQRILAGTAEMSASRFEHVCGKGDAKKWKTSIWTEGPVGEPEESMQDWLNERGLDRKTLQALASNVAAVEEYEAHAYVEVQACMHSMLDLFGPPRQLQAEAASIKQEHAARLLKAETAPGSSATPLSVAATIQDAALARPAQPPPASYGFQFGGSEVMFPQQQDPVRSAKQLAIAQIQGMSLQLPSSRTCMMDDSTSGSAAKHHRFIKQEGPPGHSFHNPLHPFAPHSGPPQLGMPHSAAFPLQGHSQGGRHDIGSQLQHQPAHVRRKSASPPEIVARRSDGFLKAPRFGSGDSADLTGPPRAGGAHPSSPGRSKPALGPGPQGAPRSYTTGTLSQRKEASKGPRHACQDADIGLAQSVSSSAAMPARLNGYPLSSSVMSAANDARGNAPGRLPEALEAGGLPPHPAKRRKVEEKEEGRPRVPRGPVPMLVERNATGQPAVGQQDADGMKQESPEAASPSTSRAGCRCQLYWPLDDEWYEATLGEQDAVSGKHKIVYDADGQEEWVSLELEGRAGRLRWAGAAPSHMPATTLTPILPRGPESALASGRDSPAGGAPDGRQQGGSHPHGQDAVGLRIGIYWPGDGCFYSGTVSSFDEPSGCHCVAYDDNENDWLVLANEKVRWLERDEKEVPVEQPSTPSLSNQPDSKPPSESDTTEQGKKAVAKGDLPARVPCLCNGLRGLFDIAKACVILEGRECTPTEFERLAGKASSKKWKSSLRIDKGGGVPGRTMGDWLVEAGIDEAKAARPRAPTLDAVRRRQGAAKHKSSLLGSDRAPGAQAHREGCLCVICKQSRRGAHLGPCMRFGKRAFVLATPHLLAGARGHQLAEVPESRTWEPEDWEQAHAPAPKPVPEDAPASSGKSKASKPALPPPPPPRSRPPPPPRGGPPSGSQPQPFKPLKASRNSTGRFVRLGEIAMSDAMDAETSMDLPRPRATLPSSRQSQAAQVSDAVLEADACNQVEVAVAAGIVPGAKAAAAKQQAKGQTLKERLAACRASERDRLTFGKSGIHGWGLFARKPLKQDSMIIEYRGDVVTRTVSELREHKYRAAGIDCYLFNINDELVVDATMRGTIGRFTNHCCSPSMYTKVLELDGQPHLVFFARADVRPGQELTYDYRFKEEEGASKMPCMCGAPNCRQTLN
ncbi:hypothetical protein WJX84_000545 [Apatococcus fuscideae]|uniref:[histone H3]-lysine(4) N-trimethyltransferase n=1 Tax=Apatococcus fuscideae TaxID=2026836 RepID=A0AAW1T2Z2_9CHLO